MVQESSEEYSSQWAAINSIAGKLGIGSGETLRKWVREAEAAQANSKSGKKGVSVDESPEVKRLRRENAELKRANEILKAAAGFFAAEFDRPRKY